VGREYSDFETNCNSSLKMYQECRRKWFYKFVLLLGKKHTPLPLYYGKIVHLALEHLDKGIDEALALTKAEYDKSCEQVAEEERSEVWPSVEKLMRAYADAYTNDEMVVIMPEFGFTLELKDKRTEKVYRYKGTADKVATFRDLLFVVEHKTTGLPLSLFLPTFTLDKQISGYYLGVEAVGLPGPLAGVMVDVLVKPRFNKDGSPGKVDEKNFLREAFFRNEVQLHEFIEETVAIMAEISSLDSERPEVWYKNPSACFNWGRPCQFLDICKYGLRPEVLQLYQIGEKSTEEREHQLQQPREVGTL
jgi:hypothetical protein